MQDRLAEQNKALEKESAKTNGKKTSSTKAVNGTADVVAAVAKKRSIRWNLEKNITKSKIACYWMPSHIDLSVLEKKRRKKKRAEKIIWGH